MTKKIFLALAALLALSLSFSSCKKDNTGGQPKGKTETKLKVEPKDITVLVGTTATLTVTVDPADTKYTFETANADIATVNDEGVVTGVKAGKTVITVKAGDAKKTVNVKVLDLATIDKTGIGDKAKDVPHFIYIPAKKSDFNNKSIEIFKAIMTDAGWAWDEESYKYVTKDGTKIGDILWRFTSPVVKTDRGPAPKYLFSAVQYVHTPTAGDPFLIPEFLGIYQKDPFTPEGQAEAEKETGILHIMQKLYGFDTNTKFFKDKDVKNKPVNAWGGFNTKAIKGTSLVCILKSHKLTKEDLQPTDQKYVGWYSVEIQITYDPNGTKQVSEVLGRTDARLVKPLLPKAGLRVIHN